VDAVDEAQRSGPGDVLVFLPGEREIREAAEALRKAHHAAGTEVLPLFARQSAQEQARVFAPSKGRRVVLATNVAETSLTVPGIRYVVDTGLARVKRYSHRNKVEQLQIEKIAQSAARQRAGRCGRVADGICFRLYDEDDFNKRPAHTDPEILRSSLAGVILRMKSLKLGEVADFPFIDAPCRAWWPTATSCWPSSAPSRGRGRGGDEPHPHRPRARQAAPRPQDRPHDPRRPRPGQPGRGAGDRRRAVHAGPARAPARAPGRRRPGPRALSRPGARAEIRVPVVLEPLESLGGSPAPRNIQQAEGLVQDQLPVVAAPARMARRVHQLHTLCAEHGWKENDKPASFEAIHKALLAGLLGHVGCKIEDATGPAAGSYLGARGIKFWPHPGSALAKKAGKWIMVAELVDTSRLFGRCLARIEPEWLEEVGGHLLKRQVSEPHWSKASGAVRAWERGTLYGLTVYPRRGVSYREIDPVLCRELFIREGLVQGEIAEARPAAWPSWPTTGAWWPRSSASSTSPAAPTCWWTKS
jgi:ATP-dependent helicase HrpA